LVFVLLLHFIIIIIIYLFNYYIFRPSVDIFQRKYYYYYFNYYNGHVLLSHSSGKGIIRCWARPAGDS